jgi:tRNA nucleotidyltransferase (CCA-adding enzyme)
MHTFNLKPSREVGIIKDALREAILDGKIKNDYKEALQFVVEKAKEMGLKPLS